MWQLVALGYTRRAIARRVSAGRLIRLYRGVYAVGHTKLTLRGRWLAAVLACGEGAVLSHRDAACLLGIGPVPAGLIDVSAPGRHTHPGIRSHVVRHLRPADVTVTDGIPVTTVSRALLDLAATLTRRRLRDRLESAQHERLLDVRVVERMLSRSAGHRGVGPLRAALRELSDDPSSLLSPAEQDFSDLIRSAGLPMPRTNVIVDGELVDAYWPAHNLIVEIDGWKFHKTHRRFEEDRQKDERLMLAGRRVVRFTAGRIHIAAAEVVRTIRTLLGMEGGRA